MGEFKDASMWMKLAFLSIIMGFLLLLFAYADGLGAGAYGSDKAADAFFVIGFLCFLAAVFLIIGLVLLDILKDNKIAQICFIILASSAGVATIIGVAIWGSKFHDSSAPTISTMHGVLGSLLAIAAGVFGIVEIVKGG